jgi:tripartite-type tricarboxylate transporter receptor subunit TctC
MVEAVADPDVKGTLEKFGYSIRPAGIEATRQFLVDETEKWGRYVKAAGIEPQ